MDEATEISKLKHGEIIWKLVSLVLVLIIAGILIAWKPWVTPSNRTIDVTGEAKLTDTPDQFVFSPTYQFKDADKTAALNALTQKSNDIIAKLKALGVADSSIKSNASGGGPIYGGPEQPMYIYMDNNYDYTLSLTITVNNQALAQKVEDYLVTTAPDSGQVTPQASFSDSKRTQLEDKAKNLAEADARQKAEQMAKNLGFNLGDVKSVTDSTGFGPILPLRGGVSVQNSAPDQSVTLEPGQNDLQYSIQVTYFIN